MKINIRKILFFSLSFILICAIVLMVLLYHFLGKATYFSDEKYSYTTENIGLEVNGMEIFGKAYIPESSGQKEFPAVIYSHGYASTHNADNSVLKSLAMSGIAVYTFDFRGGSNQSQSEGKTTDMSVMTEKDDLNAVIDMVKTLDFVDDDHLFLLGASQGGFVSAITANDRPDDISGMILFYPAFVIGTDQRKEYQTLQDVPEVMAFGDMDIGKVYYEDVWDFNVFAHISNYEGDVLIIHGDKDETVPYSYSEKAAKVYEHAELIKFQDQGHRFTGSKRTEAAELVYSFIQDHVVR
ncbi:alpha/beta fold hydrolase [Terribacillus saccharophilus]|uniref:alpha/beta hydrolase family protein n=1 Tax=Terribacillus saccharophilus TaxID=361277 RepID=UPI003981CE65